MGRFVMGVVAMVAALVLAQAVQAQPPLPRQNETLPKKLVDKSASVRDIEVDGQAVGAIRLGLNGRSNVLTLRSGHRVSLLMQNGQALSAQAVNGQGGALPVQVRNNVAARTIIIVIRNGGTVIVIVIRTRAV